VAERRVAWLGIGLVAAGILLITAAAALGSGPGLPPGQAARWGSGPGPGSPGFVTGTASAPRVVRIVASGQLRFIPDVVAVKAGETITFEVTSMGMTVHEFMVGPAADVAADREGTPEITDIGMMATKSLTYTFEGSGPFAFACHASGHYEAGMQGAIVVVP
jgi:plastocyanin